MNLIDWQVARARLHAINAPVKFIDSVHFFYCDIEKIDTHIIDYTVQLYNGGLMYEQIMTILTNATGISGIFDVNCFFKELGTHAAKFNFTPARIAADIQEFNADLERYSHELIPMRTVQNKFNNPSIDQNNLDKVADFCSNGRGKFYRAAIDAAVWYMLGFKSANESIEFIRPFMSKNGIDILGLLKKTTVQEFDFSSAASLAAHEYPIDTLARIFASISK